MLLEWVWWGIPAVPLILGLVELAKRFGFPSRWAGVLAVVLGIAGSLLWMYTQASPLAQAIAQGLVVGLAAAGLWSTGKSVYWALNSGTGTEEVKPTPSDANARRNR